MMQSMQFNSSKAGGVRWFDQKVTYDNLAQIASAVSYIKTKNGTFSRFDVQKCLSLNNAMTRWYGKPSLNNSNADNEYDKFIAQNLNVLAYSGVLSSWKSNRLRVYKIVQQEVLNELAENETNCRVFLIRYIKWVLNKFGWWHHVATYISSSHKQEDMDNLKKQFTQLLVNTMSLGGKGSQNTEVEAGRIFAKVINLIAYSELVPGIARGHVMQCPPTGSDLTYNRPNWRDIASKKPKQLTREEYREQKSRAEEKIRQNMNMKTPMMNKVRNYQKGNSEVPDPSQKKATQIHHMFPVHLFPTLADVPENMIALSGGQHFDQAHPGGNTNQVDPTYQRICLAQKLETIRGSVLKEDGMYSYEGFAKVLETGWDLKGLTPTYESLHKTILKHVD